MEEKVKDYFRRYPRNSEVYECGGVLFHTEGAAQSYGAGKVTKYERPADDGKKNGEPTCEEMPARCRELGMELPDNKKETLMEALKNYDRPKES